VILFGAPRTHRHTTVGDNDLDGPAAPATLSAAARSRRSIGVQTDATSVARYWVLSDVLARPFRPGRRAPGCSFRCVICVRWLVLLRNDWRAADQRGVPLSSERAASSALTAAHG
jgi:hypothetical protein